MLLENFNVDLQRNIYLCARKGISAVTNITTAAAYRKFHSLFAVIANSNIILAWPEQDSIL
jgi:hypothetical protein